MANATSTQLQELYVAYFGRAADPAGLDYWTETGISQKQFASTVYAQNEFQDAYGDKSVETQVNQIYNNLFDRDADTDGLLYWTQQINTGVLKVAEIATNLIYSAKNQESSADDLAVLENKVAAAEAYTAEVKGSTTAILAYQAQSTDPWVSGENLAEAVRYLATIDGTTEFTAEGITSSVAVVIENGDPTTTSATFVLTTNADTAGTTSAANGTIASDFRFTDGGNESITADIGTLNGGDVFLDGSSLDNDVLNITATAAGATFTANRIETINIDMAAGNPTLRMDNVSNTNFINVSGTVAGTIDEITVGTKEPVIKIDGYQRVLTVAPEVLDGTTTLGTAETINLEVSGATWGTTAATQSGITIDADTAGNLEILNLTSSGTAANVFTLAGGASDTIETINFLGSTDITTRADATLFTGRTLTGTAATGDVVVSIDRTGDTTATTNANLWTGIDNIILRDSAAPTSASGDGASISGLKSGQKITFQDDFFTTVLGFSGVTGSSDSATLVLDNETADTDTDISSIDIQNIETVNIESSGRTDSSTTAQNQIAAFSGDATTINLTGDTSIDFDLDIDNASSGTAGSRAVTIDASGNTAWVDIATGASTGTGSTSYTITGTAGNDVLNTSAGTNASTITGGAGNDAITGGTGNDTIDVSGGGTNTLTASHGTDTYTFGAGVDTITFDEIDETATAQVTTLSLGGIFAQNDTIAVAVAGVTKTFVLGTALASAADTLSMLEGGLASFINSSFTGVSATGNVTNNLVTITADTTVDATPTITATQTSAGAGQMTAATTAGNDAVAVATSVTGFSTGTTDDIVAIDFSAINDIVTDLNDSTGSAASGDDIVFIDYSGTTLATTAVADSGNLVKVAYSNTYNNYTNVDAAFVAAPITLDGQIVNGDAVMMTWYDADDGNMIFGVYEQAEGSDQLINGQGTFNQIFSATMSSTEYTALAVGNFDIVA